MTHVMESPQFVEGFGRLYFHDQQVWGCDWGLRPFIQTTSPILGSILRPLRMQMDVASVYALRASDKSFGKPLPFRWGLNLLWFMAWQYNGLNTAVFDRDFSKTAESAPRPVREGPIILERIPSFNKVLLVSPGTGDNFGKRRKWVVTLWNGREQLSLWQHPSQYFWPFLAEHTRLKPLNLLGTGLAGLVHQADQGLCLWYDFVSGLQCGLWLPDSGWLISDTQVWNHGPLIQWA